MEINPIPIAIRANISAKLQKLRRNGSVGGVGKSGKLEKAGRSFRLIGD
jgi:hypothetical protein